MAFNEQTDSRGGSPSMTHLTMPMAGWHRVVVAAIAYRAAAERSQASILLLSQYACAKSSAELVLQMEAKDAHTDEETVFTGLLHHIEVRHAVNQLQKISTMIIYLILIDLTLFSSSVSKFDFAKLPRKRHFHRSVI
jgi:hypothetical protein